MIPNVLKDIRPDLLFALGLEPSDFGDSKLIVVTGDNATGKSMLRRIYSTFLKKNHKIETIHLSQQARATGGVERAFVYGDETSESTGYITIGTFITGFRTSRGRENEHILLWDEPEIGLGEEAQLGAVNYIIDQLKDWPSKLRGVVVMTHSRIFVRALKDVEGCRFVNLHGKFKTADEWLDRKIVPADLEEVRTRGIETWRKVSAILKD
jgi:predicted ATPase